ncbi:MAG: helix-turn-helix domain-containing protein [Thermaerobacter sp.]|nr:helix-turn-helix domain-containing protein [Thermaerobacter sp.]
MDSTKLSDSNDRPPSERSPNATNLAFAQRGRALPARTLIYPLLLTQLPNQPMQLLTAMTWDRITDGKLRETLTTWLEEGGQIRPITERLGVHRNTLNNRLKQIEQLIGAPLTHHMAHQLKLGLDWQRANPATNVTRMPSSSGA